MIKFKICRTKLIIELLLLFFAFSFMTTLSFSVFKVNGLFVVEIPAIICISAITFLFRFNFLNWSIIDLKLIAFTALVLSALVIGVVRGMPLVEIYGDFRCIACATVVFLFIFGATIPRDQLDQLVIRACMYSVFFESLGVLLELNGSFSEKNGIVFLPGCVCVGMLSANKKYGMYILASIGLIYLASSSGFRSTSIVSLGTMLSSVLLLCLRGKSAVLNLAIGALLVLSFLAGAHMIRTVYSSVYSNAEVQDSRKYSELILKSENLINSYKGKQTINTSDKQRLQTWLDLFRNPGDYLMPKGLGSRGWEGLDKTRFALGFLGILDSTIILIAYQYGIVVLFIVLLMWIGVAWGRLSSIQGFAEGLNFCIMFFLLSLYLFITAEAFTVIPKGVALVIFCYYLLRSNVFKLDLRSGCN